MTVRDICTRAVTTVVPDDTVVDAARRMRDDHVGDVVVIDDAHRPLGILTDRDIVISAVAQTPDKIALLRVADLMSRDLGTVLSHDDVDAALARMRRLAVRRLPVVTGDGRLFGIVSLTDLLRSAAGEMKKMTGVAGTAERREREERRSDDR